MSQDDVPTGVPCPKCNGKGFHMRTESGAFPPIYKRQDCDLCRKTGWVSEAARKAWVAERKAKAIR